MCEIFIIWFWQPDPLILPVCDIQFNPKPTSALLPILYATHVKAGNTPVKDMLLPNRYTMSRTCCTNKMDKTKRGGKKTNDTITS